MRYKQTALGVAWAIIQPFFTMVVFSVFFGRLAKIPRMAFRTPFSALQRWCRGLLCPGLDSCLKQLSGSANLIKKIYFPRLVVPISSVTSGIVDFVLAFTVLLGMMLYYGIVPTINLLWLPLLLLLAL